MLRRLFQVTGLCLGFAAAAHAGTSATGPGGGGSPFPNASNYGQPPPSSVLVSTPGLEWIWASPCSAAPSGSCSTPGIGLNGFREATAGEWSAWTLSSLTTAFTLPDGSARCGSPWMDPTYDHCDYDDLLAGAIWNAPGVCDPSFCTNTFSDTFLVRTVPEPQTYALMLLGVSAISLVLQRRRER